MPQGYEIRIRKESLKFAACHMTAFPDGTKEALHGHHYQPVWEATFPSDDFESMIPFSLIKDGMKSISGLWDEKVLLAGLSKAYRETSRSPDGLEFTFLEKRYVLPSDEVEILPVDNVTCEQLARLYWLKMDDFLRQHGIRDRFTKMRVFIEESPGQGAAYGDA
jgi:6-pyruvoyl-tetrahydropterin synthase